MKIREPYKSETNQIKKLIKELGYEIGDSSLSSQIDLYLESKVSLLLVAETAPGNLSGMISGHLIPLIHQHGNTGRVTALSIHPCARSSGVGTCLLESMES
ncbi:GNAT family N-acetyltransferase [Halomonas binhaiensis]|uniref:GNAT family N-acetyltransferase n=1 Tax=Halomonas binhaiensis TaxID=2562282 RepID=A0A5C1NHS3_9GAMM|nr:GNAT family N-acetyltransferase [Halomonas binhaiensis]